MYILLLTLLLPTKSYGTKHFVKMGQFCEVAGKLMTNNYNIIKIIIKPFENARKFPKTSGIWPTSCVCWNLTFLQELWCLWLWMPCCPWNLVHCNNCFKKFLESFGHVGSFDRLGFKEMPSGEMLHTPSENCYLV